MPIPQLFAVVFESPDTVDDGSILDDEEPVSQGREGQLSILNAYRQRHGLPPVKPREQDEPCQMP